MGGSSKKRRRQREAAERAAYDSYSAERTQSLNTARDSYMDFKAELDARKQKMAEGASAYEAKAAQFAEDRQALTDKMQAKHGAHYSPSGRRRVANYKVGYGVDYDPENDMKYLEKYAGVKQKNGKPVISQKQAEHMMEKALAFGDAETIEMVQKKLQETGYDTAYNEKKAIDEANMITDADTDQEAALKAAYEAEDPVMSFEEWKKANKPSGISGLVDGKNVKFFSNVKAKDGAVGGSILHMMMKSNPLLKKVLGN